MPTEQLETSLPEQEIQNTVAEIGAVLQHAFDMLIARRDTAYAAAIEPLNAEIAVLQQESAELTESAHKQELLLPARARVAQTEADKLTVAGKHEAAAVKLAEAEEARNAPEAMRARQREIDLRLAAIETEKKAIARRIFETLFTECQAVIRAAERGLFCTLLDGLRASFYEFQERTDTGGTIERPYSFLVKQYFLDSLTAPVRSEEWTSGNRWYSGQR